MGRHVVGTVSEVRPGERKIVQAEGRSIGVFNVGGSYYAMRNSCPHQGAPLCQGRVTGMTMTAPPGQYVYGRSGEIIRCPWHGWEFDILTGKSIYDPHKCLVRTYDVTVERQANAAAVDAAVTAPTAAVAAASAIAEIAPSAPTAATVPTAATAPTAANAATPATAPPESAAETVPTAVTAPNAANAATPATAPPESAAEAEETRIETYPVTVEDGFIILHI